MTLTDQTMCRLLMAALSQASSTLLLERNMKDVMSDRQENFIQHRKNSVLMDAVSTVLSFLTPCAAKVETLVAGGDWAIDFPAHSTLRIVAAASGSSWLSVSGIDEPLRIRQGDCFMVKANHSYRHASDLSIKPVDVRMLWRQAENGNIVYGNRHETVVIGGQFAFDILQLPVLLDLLPPVILIPKGSGYSTDIHDLLNMLTRELDSQAPGKGLVIE